MTPDYSTTGYSFVWNVESERSLSYEHVYNARGLRPVINLVSDVRVTGTGSATDPFRVV